MDTMKAGLISRFQKDPSVVGVSAIFGPNPNIPYLDGFDISLLIVTSDADKENYTSHYIKDNDRIQELWIYADQIVLWSIEGKNRNVLYWLLQGEIIFDRDQTLHHMARGQLEDYDDHVLPRKLLIEFTVLLHSYLHAKRGLADGHLPDAYHYVLESLYHWARIVIVETGAHPEVNVWDQARQVNIGVYKLYEELILSPETLEQRIKLVLLALEFSIMNKMKSCCSLLLQLLESREEPWSVEELREHPELANLRVDITLLLHKLVLKRFVEETAVASHNGDIVELKYRIKRNS